MNDQITVLGADFDGVLVRDGWAPYRCFEDALHQTCLAHLLRRCRELREDHPHDPWAAHVQDVLQAALDLRDRRDGGGLTDHGLASARGRLLARLARLINAPSRLDDADRFAAHLATEFAAVFAFLWDPSVDATNWRAEQAIRPAVVIRKVCGGNRTRHGADTQQVLASVVRTASQTTPRPPPADRHDAARHRPRRARRTPTPAPAGVTVGHLVSKRPHRLPHARPPRETGSAGSSPKLQDACHRRRHFHRDRDGRVHRSAWSGMRRAYWLRPADGSGDLLLVRVGGSARR